MTSFDQLPSTSTVDDIFSRSSLNDGTSSLGGECLPCHRCRNERRKGKIRIRHRQRDDDANDTNQRANDGRDVDNYADGKHPSHEQQKEPNSVMAFPTLSRWCVCCWRWRRGRTMPSKTMANRRPAALASCLSPQHGIFNGGFSALFTTIFAIAVITLQRIDSAEAVRCYCTDEHCVPYGVCEAAVCLVGLLRANNAVIRTCGNEALGCQRNLDRWSHICSCEEHFCNTFLFLRASTNIDNGGIASGGKANGGGDKGRGMEQYQQQKLHRDGDDHRVFERVDPPPGEFATFDHPSADDDERTIKNSNLLTLLLVIVPLSVGAAAVVVVAINYYCHLC